MKKRINRFAFPAFHLLPNQVQEKTLQDEYGVRGLPHHILIGKDGKIIQNHAPGPGDELMDILKKLIRNPQYAKSGVTSPGYQIRLILNLSV